MSKSAFGYEEAEESPGLLLWQTTTLWQKRIRAELDKHSMTHSQFVVLAVAMWFAEHKKEVTQARIIKQSKLEKMTVSKALRELTEHGFVSRKEHNEDTRAKTVQITKKGREKMTKLVPLIEAIDEEFFSILKVSERKSLLHAFRSLVEHNSSEEG